MAAALGVPPGDMMLSHLDRAGARSAFEDLVARRLASEPIGYILGRVGFWTIELDVGPGALIPRADSETLIEPRSTISVGRTARRSSISAPARAPCCSPRSTQWPGRAGSASTCSAEALGFARANASRLGLADRAAFRAATGADGIEGVFDLVLCNPPYVEEQCAADRRRRRLGAAGRLVRRRGRARRLSRLAPQIGRLMAPGGIACIEIGAGPGSAVPRCSRARGFTIIVAARPQGNRPGSSCG